jgi:hypothetical protein
LLSAWKGGLQTLLDQFFESLTGQIGRAVTKSALSQARKKLKASVFEALNERLLGSLAAHAPEPRWRGWRLVAADSTTLRLPNWLENQEAFGVQWDNHGQSYVLARALGLFTTASKLMVKSAIGRYQDGERALLVQLLPHLAQDDLLVVDRGFPAVWLFAYLTQLGRSFLARIDGANWPEVQSLLRSGRHEAVFERRITPHSCRQARKLGLELTGKTLAFRLVRVVLPNGRIEVLATSLLDSSAFPANEFASLYQARWSIEEASKLLKQRLLVEQFTGELPESIRQDFHAKVFTANLAAALAAVAHESLPEAKAQRYQPNFAYILENLRNRLFGWLLGQCNAHDILDLLGLFAETLEQKRPGRKAPRPSNHASPKPRRAYK